MILGPADGEYATPRRGTKGNRKTNTVVAVLEGRRLCRFRGYWALQIQVQSVIEEDPRRLDLLLSLIYTPSFWPKNAITCH